MKKQIGQVFTPLKWAEWLINKWDIFDAWIDGAHICDPTAGQGVFVLAMLPIARKKECLIVGYVRYSRDYVHNRPVQRSRVWGQCGEVAPKHHFVAVLRGWL